MRPSDEGFPWQQVMRFGLGQLRLAPKDFWALSLPELNAALRFHHPAAVSLLSRQDLNQMMHKHPDKHPDRHPDKQMESQ
ncbi:MAG: phage tail assembly chaperone [Rhizobiaceae bacterium]